MMLVSILLYLVLIGVVSASTCETELLAGLPPHYVAYKLDSDSDIVVDGKGSDEPWKLTPKVTDFKSIYGERFQEVYKEEVPWYKTTAQIVWSDKYLYVLAVLEERQIWATDFGWELPTRPLNASNPRPPCDKESSKFIFPTCPFRNGDFEFFIAPGKHGDPGFYKEFEFNANVEKRWNHGKGPGVMTLSFPRPYHDLHGEIEYWLNNKTCPELQEMQYAVSTTAKINEGVSEETSSPIQSWTVEVKIPIKYLLKNVTGGEHPAEGVVWRNAFSRVEYHLHPSPNSQGNYVPYHKFPIEEKQQHKERNFVWPPTYFYDIHMPDQWGALAFTERSIRHVDTKWIQENPLEGDWRSYGVLSRLYYAQWAYQTDNNKTTLSLAKLQQAYDALSDAGVVETRFKKLMQVYAFYEVTQEAWSPDCVDIRIKEDAVTGWRALVKARGSNVWWSIDGWRRIKKLQREEESVVVSV